MSDTPLSQRQAVGKWQDYVNLPNVRQYDRDTIYLVVKKLNTVANRRLSELKREGLDDSPSYRIIEKEYGVGKFPTNLSKMSRQELLKQYSRLNMFLDNKTSTVTGAKEVIREFEKRIGHTMTKSQRHDFWDVYDKLNELNEIKVELYTLDSNQIFSEVAVEIKKGGDPDDMVKNLKKRVEQLYKEKMKKYATDEETLNRFSSWGEGEN